jgi:hypothetical protein
MCISGDLVLTKGKNCSIIILANDIAYGKFKFLLPYTVRAEEGSTVNLKQVLVVQHLNIFSCQCLMP